MTYCDADPLWLHEKEVRTQYYEDEHGKMAKSKKWGTASTIVFEDEIHRRVDQRVHEKIDPLRHIIQKNIVTDSYKNLGMFNAGLFDPPYLIGRSNGFDYPATSHRKDMGGVGSWASSDLKKYVANPTVEAFNERVAKLNEKAGEVIWKGGFLFVKIMNPRYEKKLIHHDVTMIRELTHFECIDRAAYIRQGATTWSIEGHMQNLNGFWMVFQRK